MTDTLVPATPHDIAPAWLEDALSSRYPGVRVGSVDVTELCQVTNTHAHLLVAYEERNGAPTDFFCKMLPLDPARREVVGRALEAREALGGEPIVWDEAWQAHRLHALYCVVAACSISTFPADAPEPRRILANAFLARVEAAIDDLESLEALQRARDA